MNDDAHELTGGDERETSADDELTRGGERLTGTDDELSRPDDLLVAPDDDLTGGDDPLTRPGDGLSRPDDPFVAPDDELSSADDLLVVPDDPLSMLDEPLVTPVQPPLGRVAGLGYTCAPMRAFLDLLEARGIVATTADLAPKLGPGELDALRHAGILRPTGQNGTEELSAPDVVRALRALWGIEGRGLGVPARFERQPAMLGWAPRPGGERAVILVTDAHHGLRQMPSRSERTLVLVPTVRQVTPELRARHHADAFMALEVLEEALTVRDGRLARAGVTAPDAPSLAPAPAPSTPPPPARAMLLGAKSWSEVQIVVVNSTTVRIRIGRRTVRATHVDLDMAKNGNREPTVLWGLLLALCEGHGTFKGRRFGTPGATKQTVTRLRRHLHALFGLDEAPFLPYRRGEGWRASFQAGDRLPDDEIELSPAARATLARAGKRR